MKKFMYLYVGPWLFEPEIMKGWQDWFAAVGPHLVDSGNPFAGGREVTKAGSSELAVGPGAITGYSIINAENLDEAEKLLEGCPIIESVRIYEAASM
jgi:hypothetical protein